MINKRDFVLTVGGCISFADLDDITRERLKDAISSIIEERYCEIDEEIKRL